MQGVVTKSTGSWYTVKAEDGNVYPCRIKGKFRIQGIKLTNPVAVGDYVGFDLEDDKENGIITTINERNNYIIRRSNKLSKQYQIVASNLDQAFLVVTLVAPKTSLGFIDRFLVIAESYHVPCTIVFNKFDLYGEIPGVEEIIDIYRNIGYNCIATSAVDKTGTAEFKAALQGKTTLLAGHSGVGKSSLINAIYPDINLRTGIISKYHQKGMHTTTFAEMFEVEKDTYIIDTPGIKNLGVVDIEDTELSHYFKEMKPYIGKCKFSNCLHVSEPECAILKAVEEGKITEERYNSYISILNNEDLYS